MKKEKNINKDPAELVPASAISYVETKGKILMDSNNAKVVASETRSGQTAFFHQKAFTLIELLVVVLIIGILTAVAIPQYTKSVKRARFAEVALRYRATEKAIQLYLLENDFDSNTDNVNLFELNPDLQAGWALRNGYLYPPGSTSTYLRAGCGASGCYLILDASNDFGLGVNYNAQSCEVSSKYGESLCETFFPEYFLLLEEEQVDENAHEPEEANPDLEEPVEAIPEEIEANPEPEPEEVAPEEVEEEWEE